jgi:hypothetical protein
LIDIFPGFSKELWANPLNVSTNGKTQQHSPVSEEFCKKSKAFAVKRLKTYLLKIK